MSLFYIFVEKTCFTIRLPWQGSTIYLVFSIASVITALLKSFQFACSGLVTETLRETLTFAAPVDTGRKLNVHKTFRRRPGILLKVLCTLNFRPVSTGAAFCSFQLLRHFINKPRFVFVLLKLICQNQSATRPLISQHWSVAVTVVVKKKKTSTLTLFLISHYGI